MGLDDTREKQVQIGTVVRMKGGVFMGKKMIGIISVAVVVLFLAAGILIGTKTISITPFLAKGYEMQGVDVSHYQGEIDWNRIEEQGIQFAYIKATEGSHSVDAAFRQNWQEISRTGLYAGVYHFFSFDSAGEDQACHFINTVGELQGKLIPAVDVEYYGDKEKNPPDKGSLCRELQTMLDKLEEQYGVKPAIYTTYPVYYRYLNEDFEGYPLWVRNVYFSPNMDMRGKWTMWQYSDTTEMEGYEGEEPFIDRDVYSGTVQEWKEKMCLPILDFTD